MTSSAKSIILEISKPFSLRNTLLGYVFPHFTIVDSTLFRCDNFEGEEICYGFYQESNKLVVKPCSSMDRSFAWKIFNQLFDIERDYERLVREKLEVDNVIQEALNVVQGYKIFSSPNLFEILASAIISQNVSFNMFRKLLHVFVEKLVEEKTCSTYRFPTPETVIENSNLLKDLGLGYRAESLLNAARFAVENGLPISGSTEDIIGELIELKGVGMYTATMYTLFGLRRFDSPIWDRFIVKNVMRDLMGLEIKSFKEFDSVTSKLWGELRGIILAILIAFVYSKRHVERKI